MTVRWPYILSVSFIIYLTDLQSPRLGSGEEPPQSVYQRSDLWSSTKTDSDMSPIPPIIYSQGGEGGKKCEIWPGFSTPVAF